MKKLFIPFLALSLFLSACQSRSAQVSGEEVNAGGGSYSDIDAQQLKTMLYDQDVVFINVHIPFAGDIPGTDLSIPYDQIEQNLSQLPADKNAPIVPYCRSGRMSQIAAEELISSGYTNIWNLQGGMLAWEQAGYEIQR
jgi:rhodanese-related sulfurtransferase